jgi:hypothetical protein
MSTIELRRKMKKQIDALDADRLRYAASMLALLKSDEAGNGENAKLARFRAMVAKAERDVAAGRFVALEKLRRKY